MAGLMGMILSTALMLMVILIFK